MIKDCKELLQNIPNPDPYDYPPELLSLQGKRKIFQLHYDPESTKDKQVFILDTCWDDVPLMISAVSSLPESAASSSSQITMASTNVDIKNVAAEIPVHEPSTPKSENSAPPVINTPGSTSIAKAGTPDTFELKQADGAPPPEQTPTSQTSKAENERPKRSVRKTLFTEGKDAQQTTSQKKSKKTE